MSQSHNVQTILIRVRHSEGRFYWILHPAHGNRHCAAIRNPQIPHPEEDHHNFVHQGEDRRTLDGPQRKILKDYLQMKQMMPLDAIVARAADPWSLPLGPCHGHAERDLVTGRHCNQRGRPTVIATGDLVTGCHCTQGGRPMVIATGDLVTGYHCNQGGRPMAIATGDHAQ